MQMDLAHKLHTSLPALVLIFARVSFLDGFSSGQNAIDDGPCLKVVLDRHELISVRKLRVRLEHCCLSSDCCAGYREKKIRAPLALTSIGSRKSQFNARSVCFISRPLNRIFCSNWMVDKTSYNNFTMSFVMEAKLFALTFLYSGKK